MLELSKNLILPMNITLTELKTAVTQLPPNQLAEFMEWLEEYQQLQWDRQIEDDLHSGKLDHLIKQAEKAFSEGKCKQM